jgi:phosphoribosylformylglycinamidine cyclo-ligase
VGDALLEVHRSYLEPLWPLLERGAIHGLVHVTGGGLPDNTPRVLPAGTAVRIDTSAMPRPPIFELLVERGGIERSEAFRVFNMGFGMLVIVPPAGVTTVTDDLRRRGHEVFEVGEVVRGDRTVELR